jgi:hypothetical protein
MAIELSHTGAQVTAAENRLGLYWQYYPVSLTAAEIDNFGSHHGGTLQQRCRSWFLRTPSIFITHDG